MLTVHLPPEAEAARRYVVDVLLGEFMGLPFRYGQTCAPGSMRIEAEGQSLVFADVFFSAVASRWLAPGSLPVDPGFTWRYGAELADVRLPDETLPCRFLTLGDGAVLRFDGEGAHCRLDIPGTVFFLLSRYEESLPGARDAHGRVMLSSLDRFQRDNIHRPLVDEYVEILYAIAKRLWPGLARRARHFRVLPSHDVDRPFEYLFLSPAHLLARAGSDVVRRRDPDMALRRVRDWWRVQGGDLSADPCNTFAWLMEQSERRGLRSSFYFICARPAGAIDGDYDLAHPALRLLLQEINRRGHEIGVHGSYNSFNDAPQLVREKQLLQAACAAGAITPDIEGGRQHFLRWDTPGTIRNWNQAGFRYDSTLTFAERAGFRCGTCHEYPVFDLQDQVQLAVRERPLVAMECSVTDNVYMGLGEGRAARDAIVSLKETCRRFNGDFTLLWHNSRLVTAGQRALYTDILDA